VPPAEGQAARVRVKRGENEEKKRGKGKPAVATRGLTSKCPGSKGLSKGAKKSDKRMDTIMFVKTKGTIGAQSPISMSFPGPSQGRGAATTGSKTGSGQAIAVTSRNFGLRPLIGNGREIVKKRKG